MKERFSYIIWTVLLALCLFLTVPELIRSFIYVGDHIKSYWYFFGGGVLYAVAALTLLKTNLQYYQTKHHESLHEAACQILLRPIESISASSSKGGQLVHGGKSNLFITLAPYSFPLFTYLFLLLHLMIDPKYPGYLILVGFSFFFFLHAVSLQLSTRQPDLHRFGVLRSCLFIADFLSMNVAIILYAVRMKIGKAFLFYFEDIWRIVKGLVTISF